MMTQQKKKVPFGFWTSPISPLSLSKRMRLSDVQWDSDGQTMVWLEGRSDRGVLVASSGQEAPKDITDSHSVRARVGYGGGDFTVSHGHVIYANVKDGRLYQQALQHGQPQALTPGFGNFASPSVDKSGQHVLFVHSYEDKDAIGYTDRDGQSWPTQLASGADFYASPCWHPSSEQMAWIEWDHPNMPWDGTRLFLGQFSSSQKGLTEKTLVAGDRETSIFQPSFSPDGRYLSYISTHNDLEALVLYDLKSRETHILVENTVLSTPAWVQGLRTYGWNHTGEQLFYQTNEQGHGRVWNIDLATKQKRPLDLAPYTWFNQLSIAPHKDSLAVIASSSTEPTRLLTWHDGRKQVRSRTGAENIAPKAHSMPQAISWKSLDNTAIHGLYYPPTSEHSWDDGLPPAIVNIHGGPTVQSVMSYSAETNFFTSRGFAVLQVNYRGSTGYGKSYMDALRENWGVYDVEDAVSAANTLAERHLADPKRMVIKGGSAGGYTVLKTVTDYPEVYCAGISLFGIGNLFSLATDTHKFEAHYLDTLIGTLPEHADRYRDRSPVFKASQIKRPLAIFQGADDPVVPPNQAETFVAALKQNGVPHVYHLYEGEGHGWRKAETIEAYFKSVLEFLRQHVLYA